MEQNSMDTMNPNPHVATTSDKQKKNRSSKKEMLNFNVYIYKVLNRVHPDLAISAKAMDMMNTMLTNMMLKLAQEASKSNKKRMKNSPLVEPDISYAVFKLFPRKMAHQALYSAFSCLITESVEEICDEMAKM
ncbi:hypothetical protein TSUD_315350 [Trifolium subterraneum]|uniref:Core Histone H2A/H2B/H3 domain-containing protein n=1 Tax=Trifolium subterraneum TaxID=3900 RepID=A0A2Z6N5Y4_TRISU|nr:hypothetical protein TSUD_315350 [Trifolium subterraneum]